jgi:hypothetical protein
MIEDFTITHAIYLLSGEYSLDLHNDYVFFDVAYSVGERRAILTWHRCNGDWVPASMPMHVELVFHGVSRFHFIHRDPEMPFTEDSCLSNAGFWTDEEWCDGVINFDAPPASNWLRAFAFQSGAIIAILADEAKAIIRR